MLLCFLYESLASKTKRPLEKPTLLSISGLFFLSLGSSSRQLQPRKCGLLLQPLTKALHSMCVCVCVCVCLLVGSGLYGRPICVYTHMQKTCIHM